MANLTDPLASYQLDRAVLHFGRSVENDMDNATKSKSKKEMSEQQKMRKREEVLSRWLGISPQQKRYRDPAIKQQG